MRMKISELSKCTGVSKDTIRYYEKLNLIHPKMSNKHRAYDEHHIEILRTILKLKQSGFTLQEIKMLFEWSQNTDRHNNLTEEEIHNLLQLKQLFQKKYEQMIQKEQEIKQIKQVLERANGKLEQLIEKNNM